MDHSNKIEKQVLSKCVDWQFDRDVSHIFDTHVRRSVPCYEIIQELIASVSLDFLYKNSVVYDLGTATGEVIVNIHKKNPDKNISYYGIDNSKAMIHEAEKKCRAIKNCFFDCSDIEDFVFPCQAELIVSAFTLQFLDPVKRPSVLHKVKNALKNKGAFILCEKIISDDKNTNDSYINYHERWKSKYFTRGEILRKKQMLVNVMHPLTTEANLEELTEAGFKSVLTLFQWCNFKCWIAKCDDPS